ncbi:Gfo/Idh/MocA family protein [Winogradskyella sp. A3E31]|uniref:Gfo/Idh/MocA family protein n=1 Tax=Winogradskyella sp. A3E31 TaxID=3349637 RepID=UPI00398B1F19
MSKVINWGIIGAGKIARKFASDLNTIADCKLIAIASRSINKAQEFQNEFGAQIAYGSYEALVKDSNIHAVYIATPHSFHKEHSILCLNHKKAVLCEKPFAMNSQEVEEMIHCAKENDTLLMEALWTYFLPHYQYVLDALKSKKFGDILSLKSDFGFHPKYDETSRVFKKELGGGSLLDIGIYPIFAALSSLGKPDSISATAEFYNNGADSKCDMLFTYNKAEASLNSTFLEETPTEAIFTCEKGTIKINGRWHEPSSVTLTYSNGEVQTKHFPKDTFGYNYEIEHFNQLLREGKTESDIMTYNFSRLLINTLDSVRSTIGLDY